MTDKKGGALQIKSIQARPVNFACSASSKYNIMVSSHERSGTHFLINTLALNTGYTNRPSFHFDPMMIGNVVDFHNVANVRKFLHLLLDNGCVSIIKNHFHADFFFAGENDAVHETTRIIYILRDPVPTLASFRRFMHSFGQHKEGPVMNDLVEFAFAAPAGSMMRYQSEVHSTVIGRWLHHATGWLAAAARSKNVHVVKYSELEQRFDETVSRLCAFLGQAVPDKAERPDRVANTVYVADTDHFSREEESRIAESLRSRLNDKDRETFDRLRSFATTIDLPWSLPEPLKS